MCEESARMENERKRGVSVYSDRNEFCVDKHLARITRPMDKTCPSWEKKMELEEISLKTVREFPEKSDRESVWYGQQNRNAELKSVKINQIWNY
jgi:hypothetical protein